MAWSSQLGRGECGSPSMPRDPPDPHIAVRRLGLLERVGGAAAVDPKAQVVTAQVKAFQVTGRSGTPRKKVHGEPADCATPD